DSYLRTGQSDLALKTLEIQGTEAENSYELAEARAVILAELGRLDEARTEYQKAQQIAVKQGDRSSAVRAKVNLAGTYIDTQRASEAQAIMAEVQETSGLSRAVRDLTQLHRAELAELNKDPNRALQLYEELTQAQSPDQHDPDLYRKCYHLARAIGDETLAQKLFKRSEEEALLILSKGEVFSLESLARLYLEAGTNLEQAEKYALRNLEVKQDRSARETLNQVRQRLSARLH
ncbi:MAG TPA: hypothetical protein VJ302_15485, partial [Blastocatellia bacterium]|nr:hypothetical protein [Blastocatellia bacterium]